MKKIFTVYITDVKRNKIHEGLSFFSEREAQENALIMLREWKSCNPSKIYLMAIDEKEIKDENKKTKAPKIFI